MSDSVSKCVSSIVAFLRIPKGFDEMGEEGMFRRSAEGEEGMFHRSAVGKIDCRRCGCRVIRSKPE